MDLLDAIYQRRSVRDYRADAVDKNVLRDLIDAAIQAPSANNEQPWRFTVVQDQATLDRISSRAKTYLLSTSAGSLLPRLRNALVDPGFQIFYHAPALVVISANHAGRWMTEDCALAAGNLMLAACASGLGSCWIGLAQSWLQTAEGKEVLKLPPECHPVAPISVGRAKADVLPVLRKEAQIDWLE